MSNPTLPPSSDLSPTDEALRGGDDNIRRVVKKFFIALKRQYFTMGLSLRLGDHLDRLDGVKAFVKILAPDIRQHALIVLRETLEEARARGIALETLHGFNTERIHQLATQQVTYAALDSEIPDHLKVNGSEGGIFWPATIRAFQSHLQEFMEQPDLGGELYGQMCGECEKDPVRNINRWHPVAQEVFLKTPGNRSLLLPSNGITEASTASVTRGLTSASSVPETVRPELIQSPGPEGLAPAGEGYAASAASSAPGATQSVKLSEELSLMIGDYLSLVAPPGTVAVSNT